jgi:hypothetical protein
MSDHMTCPVSTRLLLHWSQDASRHVACGRVIEHELREIGDILIVLAPTTLATRVCSELSSADNVHHWTKLRAEHTKLDQASDTVTSS